MRNTFLWFIRQAAYGILLYQPELIYTTCTLHCSCGDTHTHTHIHCDRKAYIKCQQHRRRNKALDGAGERQPGCGRGAFAASRQEQNSLEEIRGKCFLGREHHVQSSRVWPMWPVEGQLVIAVGLRRPGGWKDTDGWSPWR